MVPVPSSCTGTTVPGSGRAARAARAGPCSGRGRGVGAGGARAGQQSSGQAVPGSRQQQAGPPVLTRVEAVALALQVRGGPVLHLVKAGPSAQSGKSNPQGVVFAFHKFRGKRSVSGGALQTFHPPTPIHYAAVRTEGTRRSRGQTLQTFTLPPHAYLPHAIGQD